ncbi:hypothetical protein N7488_010247 [Penicillium malachiteum]|nr:hypothetical protein N7488_010247 [Penicillium malachiteum]
MDMNHLIGQRFNLISKSDIRYVGTLHEINPEASTIALENVMSYGTEGRRGDGTDVPPSNTVYEYIVFRGSDVKDISVAEEEKKEAAQPEPPRVPDDPAILGQNRTCPDRVLCLARNKDLLLVFLKALPNNHRVLNNPPPVTPNSLHSKAVHTPPYGQRFGPPQFPPGPGFPPYGAPPGWYPPPGHGFPQGPGQFPPNMPMGPPGQQLPQQRPGPPGVPPPAKATSELPVGDKVPSKPATPAAQNAPTPPVESKPSVAEAVQGLTGPTAIPQKNGRVVPAIPMAVPKSAAPAAQGNGAITDATAAATAAVAAAMAKLPQPAPPKKPGQGDTTADGLARKMNEMRPFDAPRAPRGGHQHTRGGRGGVRNQHKKIEVPESDYDFETANAKFNKQDLVKEAIATGTPAAEAESLASAEVEAFGETASNVATSHSGTTPYNRTNSFFDNISSEARDREENSVNRVGGREWRGEEEKRNIETFGQGSVDGYRGRGRGYGRGRGFGRGRGYGGRGRGYGGRGGGRPTSQSTGVPSLG